LKPNLITSFSNFNFFIALLLVKLLLLLLSSLPTLLFIKLLLIFANSFFLVRIQSEFRRFTIVRRSNLPLRRARLDRDLLLDK